MGIRLGALGLGQQEHSRRPIQSVCKSPSRGEGVKRKKFLISDDRTGPVGDIKTSPNMSKAGRAAATIRKIVEQLLVDPASYKWRKAALQFLHSTHSTVESLQWTIGEEAFYHVVQDLTRLLKAGLGQASGNTCTLQRVHAICKKVEKGTQAASNAHWSRWLDLLFERGASKGHKFVNADNNSSPNDELNKAADGTTHPLSHLKDQEDFFGGLWEADSASAKESFADTLMQLRDWVMKCRGEGREILEDVLALVDAPRLQIILAKFKSRTSTVVRHGLTVNPF